MTDAPKAPVWSAPACPAPREVDRITLAHGAGAGASSRLLDERILPRLGGPPARGQHDAACLEIGGARLAFTTDTFVVHPLEFPGGDIGSLAVHGTVNDLAMAGAVPRALSCGLVLEEGLPLERLDRLLASMDRAAREVGVPIVTGDTKVVERGKGDGVFVNTTGVGELVLGSDLRPDAVRPGDAVLVSGNVGDHGAAVLSVREGLSFESEIVSDSAALHELVQGLLAACPETHCLRDPTRGGLGATLHEIARACAAEIALVESALPVSGPVRSACELLGLDPLFLACEGRLVAFVPEAAAERGLAALRSHPLGEGATRIGSVAKGRPRVVVETRLGARRLLPLPAGEPLPRIC